MILILRIQTKTVLFLGSAISIRRSKANTMNIEAEYWRNNARRRQKRKKIAANEREIENKKRHKSWKRKRWKVLQVHSRSRHVMKSEWAGTYVIEVNRKVHETITNNHTVTVNSGEIKVEFLCRSSQLIYSDVENHWRSARFWEAAKRWRNKVWRFGIEYVLLVNELLQYVLSFAIGVYWDTKLFSKLWIGGNNIESSSAMLIITLHVNDASHLEFARFSLHKLHSGPILSHHFRKKTAPLVSTSSSRSYFATYLN